MIYAIAEIITYKVKKVKSKKFDINTTDDKKIKKHRP